MSEEKDFYVGYGAVPDKDRRFLLRAVPAGLLGIAGAGAFIGSRAASAGGGRWETGTPVTLTGRLGFHPHPILWTEGQSIVLAGIGKIGADEYLRPFDGQEVQMKGIRIVRDNCFMLGVADGDTFIYDQVMLPLPGVETVQSVRMVGEIVDAQCFMGIMNPGYGRTHLGCATQCVRGGQPVYFSTGISAGRGTTCSGDGFLLANENGEKINDEILNIVARPVAITANIDKIGDLLRLRVSSEEIELL
jgi:hypothetical protein